MPTRQRHEPPIFRSTMFSSNDSESIPPLSSNNPYLNSTFPNTTSQQPHHQPAPTTYAHLRLSNMPDPPQQQPTSLSTPFNQPRPDATAASPFTVPTSFAPSSGRRNSSLNSLVNASNPFSAFYSQPRAKHSLQQARVGRRAPGIISEEGDDDDEEEEHGSDTPHTTTAISPPPDQPHSFADRAPSEHTFRASSLSSSSGSSSVSKRSNDRDKDKDKSTTNLTVTELDIPLHPPHRSPKRPSPTAVPALRLTTSWPETSLVDLQAIESSVWPERGSIMAARRKRRRIRMSMVVAGVVFVVGIAVMLGVVVGHVTHTAEEARKGPDDA